MNDSNVETKAQRVAAQVNAAYGGEAPAYAARIAATDAGAQEQRRRTMRHHDDVVRAFVFDDGSEIVIDGADWSVKCSNTKEPEGSYMPTVYVVLNEHTLGYVQTPDTRIMGVLHGRVLRGGHDWKNGGVAVTPGIDLLRPATEEDFDAYRVMPPPNFRPATPEELATYRIMSPIRPEPEQASEPEAEETPPFRP